MKKIAIVIAILSLLYAGASYAQTKEEGVGTKKEAPSTVKLPNPLGDGTTVPSLIGRVINAALGVVGSLALLMFVYGGFTWMLSGGNSQAVEKGKNILIWATLGLVIIFISYALVNFIIETAT